MLEAKLVLVSAILGCFCLWQIDGHGKMIDPLNRSSLWREPEKYGKARINTEDNENFCGGYSVQHLSNGGKCGPCGDDYRDPVPRKNENGGYFGRGRIVTRYRAGDKIKVKIDLSANHLGYFEFSLCKLQHPRAVETEDCFERNRLQVTDTDGKPSYKYHVGSTRGIIPVEVQLPVGFHCKRCVLRWHYSAGNNWGTCPDGRGALGCGPQETFRSCSDIAVE